MENQNCCSGHSYHHIFKGVVMAILALFLVVYLGVLTRNALRTYDYIGKNPETQDRITVQGTGKVTAKPDIALINLGVITEKNGLVEAQKENSDKMNLIVNSLKNDYKIAEADIQTSNYNINPKYDWSNGRRNIVGYTIEQSVTIKLRNFDNIGNILAKAGSLGANNIDGPNFSIDDTEKYKVEARKEAIEQAKDKAKALSKDVGIDLGRIVNYSEGWQVPSYPIARNESLDMLKSIAPSPVIESGSQEVQVEISLSYEIK